MIRLGNMIIPETDEEWEQVLEAMGSGKPAPDLPVLDKREEKRVRKEWAEAGRIDRKRRRK